METHEESGDGVAWRIVYNQPPDPVKTIVNKYFDKPLEPTTYNYVVHTPVVIVPINKTSALILSEWNDDGDVGLRIHDLRLVVGEMVGSISFNLRGSQFQLKKFKHEMLRAADESKCVGIGFFLRKMYYTGFSGIYAPKILKPKEASTLRAGMSIIQTAISGDDNAT